MARSAKPPFVGSNPIRASMKQSYFIKTFGCQSNKSDSERIAGDYEARGYVEADSWKNCDELVINTCAIRQRAEHRARAFIHNVVQHYQLAKQPRPKIIFTGCMLHHGKNKIMEMIPVIDEILPVNEVGFNQAAIRRDKKHAWVPISNGCNNFCTFCVVPFTRGREISRPFEDIIKECHELKVKGYKNITLLGQNVNSYGADLLVGENNIQAMRDIDKKYFGEEKAQIPSHLHWRQKISVSSFKGAKPVFVKHLGRYRIPTLFPYLLEQVAKMGFEKVDFISSNPWDFSSELIDVIAKNKNITRLIHLPVQSGDDSVLKRMNRWYTADEYLRLISKIKNKISNIKFTTDIIVGFCGETDQQYANTEKLCQQVNFQKAYIAMYSLRPFTAATKVLKDDVPFPTKKKRWMKLDTLVNKYVH